MAKIGTITLTGKSGKKHTFNIYPYDTSFKELAAVYYISKRTEKSGGGGNHKHIYIGQTENLAERFQNHHKEECFKRNKANCKSILQESSEKKRLEIEADLIDALTLPCNG